MAPGHCAVAEDSRTWEIGDTGIVVRPLASRPRRAVEHLFQPGCDVMQVDAMLPYKA
jgi:hypothetical protein